MRHTVYWASIGTEYGGADLFVNDIPVVRMGPVSKVSRPLNEYLRRGENRLSLRLGRGYRNPGGDPPPALPAQVLVEAVEFLDVDEIGRTTLGRGTGALLPAPVGTPLIEFGFRADALRGGLSPLDGFAPVGPPERALVMAKLDEAAGWWRAGDTDRLLAFMGEYAREFVGSYALESEDYFREAFTAMVAAMASPTTRIDYAPAATLLEVCGDGRLIDCRRTDQRAAITVRSPKVGEYDFNLIVGVRGGTVTAYR